MIYQKSFLRETVFPFYFHLIHRSYLPSAYLISSFHCEFYENSKNNCHELSRIVTLSHQPYLAGDGHSSMLLLWGYRRASDNAQLSFRQKIIFGRGKFSNDLSLAKRPLAPFSIQSASNHPAAFSLLHSASSHPVASSLLHSASSHPAASSLLRPRHLHSSCCPPQ